MGERVNCTKCGTSILIHTFERCQGLCRPCFKKDPKAQPVLKAFDIAFEKTFIPFPKFRTNFGFEAWHELDSYLGGPLFLIREEGHCDYVFGGNHPMFPGFNTLADFEAWCLTHLHKFRVQILRMKPDNRLHQADKRRLFRKYRETKRVLNLAMESLRNHEQRKKII